jgi:hypothetical protein
MPAGIQLRVRAGGAPEGVALPIAEGREVTYTYVVTNTGDTFLSTVIVFDERFDRVVGQVVPPDIIWPGGTRTFTASTNVYASTTNHAEVSAWPSDSYGNHLGTAAVYSVDAAMAIVVPPPAVTAPADTVRACGADLSTNALGLPAVVSNPCGGAVAVTFTDLLSAAGCPVAVTQERIFLVTTECGHAVAATQHIYLTDSGTPALAGVPADATVAVGQVGAPAAPAVLDDCALPIPVFFVETTNAYENGFGLARVWTATDSCGHATAATQNLWIVTAADVDGDGLPGDWEFTFFGSPTNAEAGDDEDHDKVSNLDEYFGDTNPTDKESRVHLVSTRRAGGSVAVGWQGGASAWQWLDWRDAADPTAAWTPVYTASPPTTKNMALTNLPPGIGRAGWFRIRSRR